MKNKMNIEMAGPDITEEDIKIVNDALRNGWYGKNKYYYCELFQKEFAKYHGRKFGIMTTNCTSAIHLLLKGLGIKEGDEVIVPECTWIGSVAGVKWVGAKTVFADIREDTWCIHPPYVEKEINKNTKAIIAVNLHGNMCDMGWLGEICEKNNLFLIEDAAQSLGSILNGVRSGKFGVGSVFSFHRTKTITTGEGGMLLLDDEELYERCMFLRDHGRSPYKPYWIDEVATKYMPSNVQAALGYAQFLRLNEIVEKKRKQYYFYKEQLSSIPDIKFNPDYYEDIYNSFWITGVVLGESHKLNKNEFIEKMKQEGVPIRPFFYPLSSMPPYREYRNKLKNFQAYDICNRGINLPCALNLTEEQMVFICEKIKKILKCK